MAELHQILDEVTRAAILAGGAIACLLLVGILLPVGLVLFLGEWLFGSIGWGVLLGTLLLTNVAAAAVLAALGLSGRVLGRNAVVALALGVVIGVLFAFHLPNLAWTAVGESINLGVDPAVRPLVTGVVLLAIVFGIVGLIVGGAAGSAIGGLLAGVVLGALAGAVSAISFDGQAGAALGVLAWLIAWLGLNGAAVASQGIDMDALKARFWPQVTIDTTKETVEWVKDQLPIGPRS